MVIAWTEQFRYAVFGGGVDNAWTNWNLYSAYGIPKGAIVEFIIGNLDTGAEVTCGVRTGGSSLNRYLAIHESEAGGGTGQTVMRMLVKTSVADGIVEYYTSNKENTIFQITGYWTGVDWTETWITKAITDTAIWTDWDLYTLASAPKGSVCHIIETNSAAGSSINGDYTGIRTGGSSLNRTLPWIVEAESGGVSTCSAFVKTDLTSGYIQIMGDITWGESDFYCDGFFETTLDYVEMAPQSLGTPSTGAWTDWDVSSYLDEDGRVCDIWIDNAQDGATATIGLRGNGSSLTRSITANEAEGGGSEGFGLITQSDANGIIEYYATYTDGGVKLYGYFKFTTTEEILSYNYKAVTFYVRKA